ncbi:MAG: hypothetical protein ACK46X_09510 [Candidatus Sericytochromatia bacterium]
MTPDATAPTPRLPWMRAVLAAAVTVLVTGVMQTWLIWAPPTRPEAFEHVLRALYLTAPAGLWVGYAIAGRPRRGLVAVAGGFAAAIAMALLMGGIAALTSTGDVQPGSSFAMGIVMAYPLGTLLAAVCAGCDLLMVTAANRDRLG